MVIFSIVEDLRTVRDAEAFLDSALLYDIALGKRDLIVASDDEDGSTVGVLVYELFETDGNVRINWIKVREDMRGRGIAMRLHLILFSACVELKWASKISAVFPEERDEYVDMVRLLINLGYRWTEDLEEILVFKLSEVLKNEMLFKKEKSKNTVSLRKFVKNNSDNINNLKNKWLNAELNVWGLTLVKVCKEMDSECSMVVEKDDIILAFALVSEENDKVILRYLASDKSSPESLLQVLQGTILAVKEKYGENTIIETTVINDEAKRLFMKLISSYSTRRNSVLALAIR